MNYPEHEKLAKIKDQSQAIGGFLDWLLEKYSICGWSEGMSSRDDRNDSGFSVPAGFYPIHKTIDGWLEEYFGIDHTKLMLEKEQMLDAFRSANG